jgi:poly(3-hydroxybutyrate) depolymerase
MNTKTAALLLASTLVACGSNGNTANSGSGGAPPSSAGTTSASGAAAGGAAAGGAAAAGAGGAQAAGGALASGGHAGTGSGGAATGGTSSGGGALGTAGATGGGTPTPSPGCSVTGSSTGTAQDKMLTVSGQATVRTYRLSVPTSYVPTTPLPLIFGFHGVSGNGKGTQSSFGLESASTGGGKAIFVYPDALSKVEPDGTSAIDWVTPLGAANKGIDFAFFEALVKEIENNYCVDTSRVFATGISAGGIFTNFVGCWYGDILRGIAPVASIKPWSTPQSSANAACTGSVASMVIHGTNDPFSNYTTDGLVTRDFWVAQNGCQSASSVADPTTPNACVDYQGCKAGLPVVLCSHDEGHAWPVKTGFSCSSTSTVCFDANTAVWNFFMTLPALP